MNAGRWTNFLTHARYYTWLDLDNRYLKLATKKIIQANSRDLKPFKMPLNRSAHYDADFVSLCGMHSV